MTSAELLQHIITNCLTPEDAAAAHLPLVTDILSQHVLLNSANADPAWQPVREFVREAQGPQQGAVVLGSPRSRCLNADPDHAA